MKVNLGCGNKKLAGFINVDSNPLVHPDLVFKLGTERFPWEDDSVEQLAASHILEHLSGEEFIFVMKEIYRVLKPGGSFCFSIPHPRHDVFLNDPTHKLPVTPTMLSLFSMEFLRLHNFAHTPFAKYHEVDFTLLQMEAILDDRVDAKLPREEIDRMERTQNNVIVEYHGIMAAMKPFDDVE